MAGSGWPVGGGGSGGGSASVTVGTTVFTSGTTGSVLFIGASAVVQQDNSHFFWDDTNNRLGIGTATPSATTHSLSTTEQLRLGYDASNYNSFTVSSVGSLTIAPTGTNPNITLTPSGTGVIFLGNTSGMSPLGSINNLASSSSSLDGARIFASHASFAASLLRFTAVRAASSAYNFFEARCGAASTGLAGTQLMSLRGDGILLFGTDTTWVSNEPDPVTVIARNLTGVGASHHGYTDCTVMTLTGGATGVNSFDAYASILGTADYDHYAAFQVRPIYNSSGTISRYMGLQVRFNQVQGTISRAAGVEMINSVGTGTITDQVGLYVHTFTRGGTNVAVLVGDSDVDQNLIRVGVTGNPLFSWNQSGGVFAFSKGATFAGNIIASGTTSVIRLKGYTVATLPTGTQGDTAFVTDALGPTFLATIIGGGAVVTSVFYDGTNWVAR